jgi:hypothetical protein
MVTAGLFLLAVGAPALAGSTDEDSLAWLEEEDDDEFEFFEPGAKKDRPKRDEEAVPGKEAFLELGDDPEWDMEDPELDEGDRARDPDEDESPSGVAEADLARQVPKKAVGLGLDTTDKTPLADNWPIEVVARDLDSVVCELPVLIGRSRADFAGGDYWVVAEVAVDGEPVAETRHRVTGASMAELGPTIAWLKVFAPVSATRGTIEFQVSKTAEGAEPAPLFTRTAEYRLQ